MEEKHHDVGSGTDLPKPDESHVEDLRRQQTHIYIDPKLDKRIDRKFDKHIMPWLFGIW